jgi:hypothetical protein
MKVIDLANLQLNERISTVQELASLSSLRHVLAWANAKPKGEFIREIVSEVITQDEFTHDVIVPYKEHYLVFDTT